jgi:hypothetical protein
LHRGASALGEQAAQVGIAAFGDGPEACGATGAINAVLLAVLVYENPLCCFCYPAR